MEETPQPKISLPEILLIVPIAIISDLINPIPILNWVVTLFTLPGFGLYFYWKGVKGYASVAGNLLEFFPALSALPGVTAGVIATIIIDRVLASRVATQVIQKTGPAGKLMGAAARGKFLKGTNGAGSEPTP
ncbi:MAG: hypothetical protein AAB518_00240 [Patescibacteria group bacterium]